MKLKELESELQPLKGFNAPKRTLEQYVTSPHLASRLLFTAQSQFDDLQEKSILDLGCGCAVLSIGSVMLGASKVLSVDIDPDALSIAKENIETMEMEDEIELINARLGEAVSDDSGEGTDKVKTFEEVLEERDGEDKMFDTVVMNPPFGSWRKGIDMVFLETACKVAKTAVYSLNKTSTRDFILRKAQTFGFEGTVIAEMRYDLPKTMAHHSKKSVDIQVDMWRFERINNKP